MFRTINKYIYIIIIMLFSFQYASASDNYIPVRVGISDTSFKTYIFDSIEFNDANNLNILDSATGYMLPIKENSSEIRVTSENNLFRIYVDGELAARNLTGPILVSAKEGSLISIKGLKRKGKQALYRGAVNLVRSSKDVSKFSVVNVLSLKNYLRGVVPNEMPVKFGLEALKAQTVAARNYAVAPRVKAYQEFDLCDSVACQVYFGANTEDELSDKAIEQTNGIIALDKENKPILALYSSTAGGYTESYEFAFSDPQTKEFPSKDIPYLTAVADNEKFETLEDNEKAENFYTSKPEAFDDLSPYYRWSKIWTVEELENVLAKTMPAQSKTGFIMPAVQNSEDIGKLISIKALKRGKSGKIISLEIKTDKNTYIVQKELVIRRCFQKDGISLPSANFVINYIDAANPLYKFSGGGFGHGVGLSQWGAGKMGSLGYTFDEILQHYYQGIKLAVIPMDIYSNNKITERSFYTEQEKANVYIINPDNIKKMKITINQKELDVKLKEDINITDISKYLIKGENKISFKILDEPDYLKKVTVFTEIKEVKNE
ncbi:MAG: SpoIID/LytB domain-containing protein [Candidatus Gastranaerophilales bacterium]|nr:SpoIID/LytB domain-containing protein [Candidatus Gastranaerophilales bacterium]